MFFDGSRYLRVPSYETTDADGVGRTLKRAREPAPVEPAQVYQVREGDRLDLLAHKFYRDSRKWWLIADANPQCLTIEELLQPGQVITIPRDRAADR